MDLHRREQLVRNAALFAEENGVAAHDVLSVKLRPMRGAEQAYYGGDVYSGLEHELKLPAPVSSPYGWSHRPQQGLLMGQRETGPEWFAVVKSASDALSPFVTINDFALIVGGAGLWLTRGWRKGAQSNDHSPTKLHIETRKITLDDRLIEDTIVTIESEVLDAKQLQKVLARSLLRANGKR
jgi:hypothetical protein